MAIDMKKLIAEQLFRLAKEKGAEKITVKELVEVCHISSQAFYYHFRDITDVVEWALRKDFEQVLAQSLSARNSEEALGIFVSLAEERHEVMRKALTSPRHQEVEEMFFRFLRDYLEKLFCSRRSEVQISRGDLEMALDFYAYGISGLLMSGIRRESFDAGTFTRRLYRLLRGEIISGSELN